MHPTFEHINRHGMKYAITLLILVLTKHILDANGVLPVTLDAIITLVVVFFLWAFVNADHFQPARTKTDKFFKVLYYVVIWMNLITLVADVTIKITIN